VTSFGALTEPPRRVQVLRALHLGDLLVAVPAFRAMRAAWPDARIELIGLPWAADLVARLPGYVDALVEFPGWPGVPERAFEPTRVAAFLAEANADPADLAIQLHGSGVVTNSFVALLGARRTAGRVAAGHRAPDPATFVPFDDQGSELRGALSVLEPLGVRPVGEHLEVSVLDRDRGEIDEGPAGRLGRGGYAVVHPGSSSPSRRWPVARFAVVADAVAAHVPVVVTGGEGERYVAARLVAAMRRPAIDLSGRTSLGGLFALVEGAGLVVSNDTGVAHVADAVSTPSVVVFTVSDPARWGPLDRSLHRVVRRTPEEWPSADEVRLEALDLIEAVPRARAAARR
jgi:ADP-heptose:LPS heptosyltransferase